MLVFFRSADGVCPAGTVVVSRLKMGEVEEADHIATNSSSQKVRHTLNSRCGENLKENPFLKGITLKIIFLVHCSTEKIFLFTTSPQYLPQPPPSKPILETAF